MKKNGDKKTFPKKGDTVRVRYRGTLENGTVFDENMTAVKKKLPPPLKFKVGTGKVIRGVSFLYWIMMILNILV